MKPNLLLTTYIALIAILLSVSGCAQFNKYISDNPALTYVGVSTAVSQYIKSKSDGSLVVAQSKARVISGHVDAIRSAITDDVTTIADVVNIVKHQIGYDKLDPADKLAADNILMLATEGLRSEQVELGLSDETRVSINRILDAAAAGAVVYL